MSIITMNSTLRDIYKTPIGHDVLELILKQIGMNGSVLKNPVIGNLNFTILKFIAGKKVSPHLFDTLLRFINSCTDQIDTDKTNNTDNTDNTGSSSSNKQTPTWWKEAVFYQIYPRSFCDTNNDHIGDLAGIISKLDYLYDLGVTALWLSPIYDSPNDDNGYDIRDYKNIMKEFGTMKEFDTLLSECHKRSMHLIMDLVVNHTSDEHEWFKKALENKKDNKYRNYYYFRDGKKVFDSTISNEEAPVYPKDMMVSPSHSTAAKRNEYIAANNTVEPNNWTSLFSGKAWNFYPEINQYALHLFSKKQMDLNWDNPAVRNDVIDMVNWWLDKGVDGFRMDVITFISKTDGLPDGNETIGKMSKFYGLENYIYGPHLHEYLRELQAKSFALHNAFSVGEAPVIGMNMSRLLTDESRHELNMVFNFDVLETKAHQRFDIYDYDLNGYRDYIIDWMEHYGSGSWMSLFFDNHDNPRMISKVEKDSTYHATLAKLLCTMQFTLKGTPFVFQGDEWGIPNHTFTSMKEIRDVESRNLYETLITKMTPDEAFEKICAGTRDHARILLPWSDEERALQFAKEDVFEYYKKIIELKKSSETLCYGAFELLSKKKNRFFYIRKAYGNDSYSYIVECSLSRKEVPHLKLPKEVELVISNYSAPAEKLRAYEVNVYRTSVPVL